MLLSIKKSIGIIDTHRERPEDEAYLILDTEHRIDIIITERTNTCLIFNNPQLVLFLQFRRSGRNKLPTLPQGSSVDLNSIAVDVAPRP